MEEPNWPLLIQILFGKIFLITRKTILTSGILVLTLTCLFCPFVFFKRSDFQSIERAVQPEVVLRSMSQLRSVSFNPRDQHILAGGTIFGAVGIWDVRKSQGPVECVPIGVGHSESVTSLIWSNSKAGGEFFSASGDGQVKTR
jgi:WD40 repeat protein